MPEKVVLSERLKVETSVQHQEAEHTLAPFIAGLNSRSNYIELLRTFRAFYAPVYLQIRKFISDDILPDIDERNTALLIDSDLEELDQEPEYSSSTFLPEINDVPSAFGALYVLEGSTLGGKYIRKMLLSNDKLGLTDQHTRFFDSYGDSVGTKWKTYLRILNFQQDHLTIIRAANETFTSFRSWLNKSLNDK